MQIKPTMNYHLILVRLLNIKKETGVGKDVKQREHSHTVNGYVN